MGIFPGHGPLGAHIPDFVFSLLCSTDFMGHPVICGTGKKHDWSLLRKDVEEGPFRYIVELRLQERKPC